MTPATDQIRRASRPARTLMMAAAMGGTPEPDAGFASLRARPLDEIAAGLELVGARE